MKNHSHIAQINIAKMKAPLDDPLMQAFVDGLDAINALADAAPGFVWRLQNENNNATDIQAFDDEWLIVNLSVWESTEALGEFTYKTAHVEFIRQRKLWFERLETPFMALWWIPVGHIPTTSEAKQRLTHLEEYSSTPLAFTFRHQFEADVRLKAKVVSAHKSNYPNPIRFSAGEVVGIGKRDTQFPGWIWTTLTDGISGWAPEHFLDIQGNSAVALANYNAKELDTTSGEILIVEDIVNAWYFAHNEAGEKGWVPVKTVEISN